MYIGPPAVLLVSLQFEFDRNGSILVKGEGVLNYLQLYFFYIGALKT